MKRQSNHQLSGRRLILPALAVLALTILAIPGSAEAGVRVGVQVKAPLINAVFHSGGHGSGLHVNVQPRIRDYQITRIDRKIARKLAKRTIYTKQELLQLKRVGYTWNQIGRLLRLPSKMMRSVLKPYQIHSQYQPRKSKHWCGNDSYYSDREDRRGDQRKRVLHKNRVTR